MTFFCLLLHFFTQGLTLFTRSLTLREPLHNIFLLILYLKWRVLPMKRGVLTIICPVMLNLFQPLNTKPGVIQKRLRVLNLFVPVLSGKLLNHYLFYSPRLTSFDTPLYFIERGRGCLFYHHQGFPLAGVFGSLQMIIKGARCQIG